MRPLSFFTLLFAGVWCLACAAGYTEDKYSEDLPEAMCDNVSACETDIVTAYVAMGLDEATAQANYDTLADASCATPEEEDGDEEDDCDFDAEAAQECVDAVYDVPCDFWTTGSGWPAVCNSVCG